jgi:two-component system nitrate/nitrite response regulator NarL
MPFDPVDVASRPGEAGLFAPPAAATVLVVDDDLLVAEALVFALIQRGFIARFAVPATLEHVRDAIAWRPCLALLDVDRVEGDPLVFVEVFRASGVSVAVMGGNGRHDLLLKCADAGAAALIGSSMPLDELVRTLAGLLSAPTESKRQQRDAPPRRVNSGRFDPFAVLTPREQSVLADLMEGRTADVIAKNGWVAVSTVRSQIKSILQKLGVNSQLAAVALARRANWVPKPTAVDRRPGPLVYRPGDRPAAG